MTTTYRTKSNESQSTLTPSVHDKNPPAGHGVMDSIRQTINKVLSPSNEQERSASRGRDLASTGRGGAGNFVRGDSTSRPRVAEDTQVRGREVNNTDKITHAGRGGAGNIRSPSRDNDADRSAMKRDAEIIHRHNLDSEQAVYSTGRGGSGNIHSPVRDAASRSRSRDQRVSSGRGGAGNIIGASDTPRPSDLERLDEEGRKEHRLPQLGVQSHGRGGTGNISPGPGAKVETTIKQTELHHFSGRGGAGNFE